MVIGATWPQDLDDLVPLVDNCCQVLRHMKVASRTSTNKYRSAPYKCLLLAYQARLLQAAARGTRVLSCMPVGSKRGAIAWVVATSGRAAQGFYSGMPAEWKRLESYVVWPYARADCLDTMRMLADLDEHPRGGRCAPSCARGGTPGDQLRD